MKKSTILGLGVLAAGLVLSSVNGIAQGRGGDQPGFRPEGARGERGFPRRDPFLSTFDANNDGVIDAKEIEGAVAALKKLDKNGDGRLTMEELRPQMPGREGPGGPQTDPQEMVNRLLQFDKDGDGRLSKAELPERMQALMERADANQDGFLTKEELLKLVPARQEMAPMRGRGEGPQFQRERAPERE